MALPGKSAKETAGVKAVVDIGPTSIKGMVFEFDPDKKRLKNSQKMRSELSALNREKSGHKLHEFLFNMVKSLEKVPGEITIAIGPHLGTYSISNWTASLKSGDKTISVKNIRTYFRNLFEQHRGGSQSLIAFPLNLTANGYEASRAKELQAVRTLGFRTFFLQLPDDTGADLLDTKESFGGMPIEFVPRIAVYKEAVVKGLKKQDAFLVEAEEEETTLSLIKEGELQLSRTFQARDTSLWEKSFLDELKSFYPVGPIGPEVLVFGDEARAASISVILKKVNWLRDYSYADAPQVIFLEAQNFFEGDTFGGMLRGSGEVGLASLVFYSLYHESLL